MTGGKAHLLRVCPAQGRQRVCVIGGSLSLPLIQLLDLSVVRGANLHGSVGPQGEADSQPRRQDRAQDANTNLSELRICFVEEGAARLSPLRLAAQQPLLSVVQFCFPLRHV